MSMQRRIELGLMRRCGSYRIISRQMMTRSHLEGLNRPQLQAVMFTPNGSLQILAGPGTGKTRVLTSRLANLILNHSYSPSSICAVTFTRKASKEMKTRLHGYIGESSTEELKIGTFHSVCLKYLRTYGTMVRVEPNFLIWDEEECHLVLKYIAEDLDKNLTKGLSIKEVYEMFSRVKEKAGIDPSEAIETLLKTELESKPNTQKHSSSNRDDPLYRLGEYLKLFYSYSDTLKASNALDFTDLLIKGLQLLRAAPWAREIGRLNHVLVDEFQDTSPLQYLIVKEFFKATGGSISVVGDPDQSIYGWRGADSTVFQQMKEDLPQTQEIYLEENYRSTASIIATGISIISQDKTRPPKTLFTSHTPQGPTPVKMSFSISSHEEEFIVQEINRLIKKSDGVVDYGDCAILFRDNRSADHYSRLLRNAGIPHRQLPETSLNDRIEVIGLLAFLRLAINDAHTPMLIRAMTGPLALDDKVVTTLIGRSVEHETTLFKVLQRLRAGYDPDTNPSCTAASLLLMRTLRHLKLLMDKGASPVDLIHYIIEATNYHEFLMKRYGDNYSWRAKNVEQTIRYAKLFKGNKERGPLPVYLFLDFMRDLSRVNDFNTGQVTLLTCHSAKGLEWPVIFVPGGRSPCASSIYNSLTVTGVVDGMYPHYRSDGADEERRLLYVACTRAQSLLYLTHSESKLVNRAGDQVEVRQYQSQFIENLSPKTYQDRQPEIDTKSLTLFRKILGRDHSKDENEN
ncbi:unnamed protein product [Rhizoctonia solani]|uniref:DNA 3'-5' helicase n=1 Tax=Rhizoctonia solani TaxID=456999 RepID=A0A8H3GW95_9AGAM|nr:unnamed protein product [Rhizoctonia solani]